MDRVHVTPKELRTIVIGAVADAMRPFTDIVASTQNNSTCTIKGDKLNIEEASAFTGLAKSYIYKLVSLREIPFTKRRKKLVFTKLSLTQWLVSHTEVY